MLKLINLLSSNNTASFNISVAKTFGLKGAVYCSEILNIYQKATSKNKLINKEFVKLDRGYICNRTTISTEDQLALDNKWSKLGLLTKDTNDQNIVKFDTDLLINMITNEDIKNLKTLSKSLSAKETKTSRELKGKAICEALKNGLKCTNEELLEALKGWIDTIHQKQGYLSKQQVTIFEDTLNKYAKGDLDKALGVVRAATMQGYINCDWAINLYEKDRKPFYGVQKTSEARITNQTKATLGSISDDEF